MIIRNKKTLEEFAVTLEQWDNFKKVGISRKYQIVDSSELAIDLKKKDMPKEIKDFIKPDVDVPEEMENKTIKELEAEYEIPYKRGTKRIDYIKQILNK